MRFTIIRIGKRSFSQLISAPKKTTLSVERPIKTHRRYANTYKRNHAPQCAKVKKRKDHPQNKENWHGINKI